MISTRLTLVRHAESLANLDRSVIGGRSNGVKLSAAGRRAALALGRWWRTEGFVPDAVYASPARRTLDTATLLNHGAQWGLQSRIEDGLQELSQGSAEGRPREQWWTPAALAAMHANPLEERLADDAENHHEVQQRMQAALLRIAARHSGKHLLVVTHGIAMRTLVWALLGGDHSIFQKLRAAQPRHPHPHPQRRLAQPRYLGA